ncbi:MAG: fimbria major subunit [Bacteroides sp.]|nr:fimbria major subunit [Bacteroides sp.]
MKKTYAFAFASGLFLLGSCASDAPEMVNTPGAEEGGEYFLRIELPTATATRGDNDPYVTDVNNASFAFFDANGNWIATRRVGYGTTGTVQNDGGVISWLDSDEQGADAHSAAARCAVLQLSSIPAYVECLVNANDEATAIEDSMYETKRKESRTHRSATGKNYLKMSTAVYFPESVTASTAAVYRTAIDPEKNLFTDEDKAKDLSETGKEPLKIYVEPIVANVKVTEEIAATINNIDQVKEGEATVDEVKDATVSFVPEYYFLTGYQMEGYTVKQLTTWGALPTAIQGWAGRVNEDNEYSFNWVGSNPSDDVTYAKWDNVVKGNSQYYCFGTAANANRYKMPTTGTPELQFFPFENYGGQTLAEHTSIVVAGKYTVMGKNEAGDDVNLAYGATQKAEDEAWNNDAANADKKKRTIETEGTFYLVGIGEQFQVYASEREVLESFNLSHETDELVLDGVVGNDYSGWSGKLVVKGKTYLPKVIKYNGGYGYYSRAILRATIGTTNYNAIVRNTQYHVNIKSISGMGVGIPGPNDQIVPLDPPSPKDESTYLHMAVIINPWVEVGKQDVEW